MKILGLHIYGFGKWKDYQVMFPEDNLLLIEGDNESGKSTIRSFLMFMLFGLPPKKREFYRPKTGGSIGGRINIFTEQDGTFAVERIHEKNNGEAVCYLPDGKTAGEDWLQMRLNHIDLSIFQSIYSFDADDLTKLHSLKEEDLGEVLLGVGMTGTDKIFSIQRKLESELSERFKPQGKNPEINRQLRSIGELQSDLNKLQEEEESYLEKKDLETELKKELEETRKALGDWKAKKEQLEKITQSLSMIQQLSYEKDKMDKLPLHEHFPENGLERYYALKEQLMPLQSDQSLLQDNAKKFKSELEAAEKELLDESTKKKVDELLADADEYHRIIAELNYNQKEQQELVRQLTADLNNLRLGLSIEALESVVLPFHLEETWHHLKDEKTQMETELERIKREEQSVSERLRQYKKESEAVENDLLDETDLSALRRQADLLNKPAADEQQWKQDKTWKQVQKKKNTAKSIFIGSLLIGGIMIVSAFLLSITLLYFIGLLAFGAGAVQLWLSNQSLVLLEQYLLRPGIDTEEKVDREAALEASRVLEEQAVLRSEYEQLKKEHKQLSLQQLKLSEQKSFFLDKQQLLSSKIEKHREEFPFLQHIGVEFWPKVYLRLTACLDKFAQLQRYEEAIGNLQNGKKRMERNIALFFDGEDGEKDIYHNISRLKKIAADQKSLKEKVEQYKQWMEENEEKERRLHTRMAPYLEEKKELLAIAGAEKEDEYIRIGNEREELGNIKEKVEELHQRLLGILPQSDIDRLLKEMPQPAEVEQSVQTAIGQIDALESSLEEKRQHLSDIKSVLANMEETEQYSTIRHQFRLEKDRLKEQVKKWAVYQTAREMLMEAKKSYQETYLPKTLTRAADYFHSLTEGRYVTIHPPRAGESFEVEDNDGFRYSVNELSKGTADQLYVSLRLALNQLFGKEQTLPFLVDDAFVHFDSKRNQIMWNLIREFAERQQVIIFTCNPLLAAGMQNANIPTINLNFEKIELANSRHE
ncbi:ATP-binding protein [Sediminibacillus massiliensis]|uniref:ATP-binding protein n=1 Tax=Sediminibacillus massiliensis TaxID=1926277 RepID=UPI000988833E|nr:AAA family ATPase [Sediminibacillus massiliensis]